jgi:hypothetical protein
MGHHVSSAAAPSRIAFAAFALVIAMTACKGKSPEASAQDGGATSAAAAPPAPPSIPPEPAPPRADKVAEVPALEAKLIADKSYVAAWAPDHANERALLLTAVSDLVAFGTMHSDVDAAVKKAKLADAVMTVLKVIWRNGKLPSDFVTRVTAYLAANKTAPRLGLWNPDEKGKPLVDATALAMWLNPNDPTYVRERMRALVKGPFPATKGAPAQRSWLVNLADVLDRLTALGSFAKADCLEIGAQWSEELLTDGGTQFACKPAEPRDSNASAKPAVPQGEETVRGPMPAQSAWDGEVLAVKYYLAENLNDPDSYQHDKCTPVRADGAFWVTECSYRAKNGFGALILQRQRFYIQKGGLAGEGQVIRAEAL